MTIDVHRVFAGCVVLAMTTAVGAAPPATGSLPASVLCGIACKIAGCHWRLARQCSVRARSHWQQAASGTRATAVGAAPPHYDKWQTFTTADGLPSDKALCVLATGEDVWAGTDRGLARYRRGTWKKYTHKDGLAHDGVLSLAQDPDTGDIWIGTMRGISRYSAGRFETFTQINSGLVNDVVYGIAVHRGDVWAATAAGTSRYRIAADRWVIYDETNTPMHEIWCYSVTAADDRIYVGVWGGGLLEYQLDRDRWKHYRDPDGEMEIDLFLNDGLVHDIIASVTYDDAKRIWAGTYFGLSSYDGRKWRNFMDHDSPLISNFINFVRANGKFCWIGTDDGLNATDRENWWRYRRDPKTGRGVVEWQPAKGPQEKLTTNSIFPHNYILGIDFCDDDIWLATEKGVARGRLSPSRDAGANTRASKQARQTGRDRGGMNNQRGGGKPASIRE